MHRTSDKQGAGSIKNYTREKAIKPIVVLGVGNVIGIEDLGKVHTTTVTCISQSGMLIAIDIDDFLRYVKDIKKT